MGTHWSEFLESSIEARQTESNWAFWNGVNDLFVSGVLSEGVNYKPIGNGRIGYWADSGFPQSGISTYFNALTGKMEVSVNVGGTNSTWKEISINYGDGKPLYKNFVGPSPDVNPYKLKGEDGNVLRPLNLVDYVARNHDLGYYLKGATGVKGALFNIDVAEEDRKFMAAMAGLARGVDIIGRMN